MKLDFLRPKMLSALGSQGFRWFSMLQRTALAVLFSMVFAFAVQGQTCTAVLSPTAIPASITGFDQCIEVNRTDDLNECGTLRWALNQANAHTGSGTYIKFNLNSGATSGGTITLSSAIPTILKKVYIDGFSQQNTTSDISAEFINVRINTNSSAWNSSSIFSVMTSDANGTVVRGLTFYDDIYRTGGNFNRKILFVCYLANNIDINNIEVSDYVGTVFYIQSCDNMKIRNNWFGTRSVFSNILGKYSLNDYVLQGLFVDGAQISENLFTNIGGGHQCLYLSAFKNLDINSNYFGNVSLYNTMATEGLNGSIKNDVLVLSKAYYNNVPQLNENFNFTNNTILNSNGAPMTLEYVSNVNIKGNKIGYSPIDHSLYPVLGSMKVVECTNVNIGGTAMEANIFMNNGSATEGVLSINNSTACTVQGNYIGTSSTGINNPNVLGAAIRVKSSSGVVIGGSYPNTIVTPNTTSAAIEVETSSGHQIYNNIIRSANATKKSIELFYTNAVKNPSGGPSVPQLTAATQNTTTDKVVVSVSTVANTYIDFYLSNSTGKHMLKYLGRYTGVNAISSISIPATSFEPGLNYLVATRTKVSSLYTSELSAPISVTVTPSCSALLSPTLIPAGITGFDKCIEVNRTDDLDECGTLRWALNQANAHTGLGTYIKFNLGGISGSATIILTGLLPVITKKVYIDGRPEEENALVPFGRISIEANSQLWEGSGAGALFAFDAGASCSTICGLSLYDGNYRNNGAYVGTTVFSLKNVSEVNVERNQVTDFRGVVFYLNTVGNIKINGNWFGTNSIFGAMAGSYALESFMNGTSINGLIVEDNLFTSISNSGFNLTMTKNLELTQNVFGKLNPVNTNLQDGLNSSIQNCILILDNYNQSNYSGITVSGNIILGVNTSYSVFQIQNTSNINIKNNDIGWEMISDVNYSVTGSIKILNCQGVVVGGTVEDGNVFLNSGSNTDGVLLLDRSSTCLVSNNYFGITSSGLVNSSVLGVGIKVHDGNQFTIEDNVIETPNTAYSSIDITPGSSYPIAFVKNNMTKSVNQAKKMLDLHYVAQTVAPLPPSSISAVKNGATSMVDITITKLSDATVEVYLTNSQGRHSLKYLGRYTQAGSTSIVVSVPNYEFFTGNNYIAATQTTTAAGTSELSAATTALYMTTSCDSYLPGTLKVTSPTWGTQVATTSATVTASLSTFTAPSGAAAYQIVTQLIPALKDAEGIVGPNMANLSQTIQSVSSIAVGNIQGNLPALVQDYYSKYYYVRIGIQYRHVSSSTFEDVVWSDLSLLQLLPKSEPIPSPGLELLTDQGGPENNQINWVYSVSYLEGTKTAQSMSYLDGLGNLRQVQAYDNTQQLIMMAETAYSEEGGGVVQSMMAPMCYDPNGSSGTSTNTNGTVLTRLAAAGMECQSVFKYAKEFFDVVEGTNRYDFATEHFDGEHYTPVSGTTPAKYELLEPSAVDQTKGVGMYYSNANALEPYVDVANGFPYAYSVPEKEPASRPVKVSGVGADFKITSGKEIKYEYLSATQDELARVFGYREIPENPNVEKTIMIDPNGIGSVTYTDIEGKVIATALTGCTASHSSSLDSLNEPGSTGYTVNQNLLKTDELDQDRLSKQAIASFYVACDGAKVEIKHLFEVARWASTATNCEDCKFTVAVSIRNKETGILVYSSNSNQPATASSATDCNSTVSVGNIGSASAPHILTLDRGNYEVVRDITPFRNPTTGKTIVETKTEEMEQEIHTNLEAYQTQFAEQFYSKEKWYVLRKEKYMSTDDALKGTLLATGSIMNWGSYTGTPIQGSDYNDYEFATSGSPQYDFNVDKNKPYSLSLAINQASMQVLSFQGLETKIKISVVKYGTNQVLGETEEKIACLTCSLKTAVDFISNESCRIEIKIHVISKSFYSSATTIRPDIALYDLSIPACSLPVDVATTPLTCLSDRWYADEVEIGEGTQVSPFQNRKLKHSYLSSPNAVSIGVLTNDSQFEEFTQSNFSLFSWWGNGGNGDVAHSIIGHDFQNMTYNDPGIWFGFKDFAEAYFYAPEDGEYGFRFDVQGNQTKYKSIIRLDGVEINSGIVLGGNGTYSSFNMGTIYLTKGKHKMNAFVFSVSGGVVNNYTVAYRMNYKFPSSSVYNNIDISSEYFSPIQGFALKQLDGREKSDLRGTEDYNVDDYLYSKDLKATPDATVDYFKEAYGRQNFKILLDNDITAINLYDVLDYSTSEINETGTKLLPTIYENKQISPSDKQSFYLLRVKMKEDCKLSCRPQPPMLDCATICKEQRMSYLVELQETYKEVKELSEQKIENNEDMVYKPGNYTALQVFTGLQFPLANNKDANNALMDLLERADDPDVEHYEKYAELRSLVENYDANLWAFMTSNVADCEAACSLQVDGGEPDKCKVGLSSLELCLTTNIQEIQTGTQYILDQWTGSSFPFMNAAGTAPLITEDERSKIGEKLYNYLMAKDAGGTYTNFTQLLIKTKTQWAQTFVDVHATCSICVMSDLVGEACPLPANIPSGYFPVLDDFPVVLKPLLEEVVNACKADYLQTINHTSNTNQVINDCNDIKATYVAENPSDLSPTNCDELILSKKTGLMVDYLAQNIYGNDVVKIAAVLAEAKEAHANWFNSSFSIRDFKTQLLSWGAELKCNGECENIFATAFNQYITNLKKERTKAIVDKYINGCYGKLNESFTATYFNRLYHYTLYEYDKSNALVATVPPEGVDYIDVNSTDTEAKNRMPEHRLKTEYSTNTLGQLQRSKSPDGGETKYLYDQAGRIRFSQNAEQYQRSSATNSGNQAHYMYFSYTLYEGETSRIVETGEASYHDAVNNYYPGFAPKASYNQPYNVGYYVDDLTWPNDASVKKDVAYISYDKASTAVFSQKYLEGRVSKISNVNASTHFSYDEHGRVNKVMQELTPIFGEQNSAALQAATKYKTVDYEYHPVTSQVTKVIYQKGVTAEQFMQRYFYDANDRIASVEVSLDGIDWEPAGAYGYYAHGPLKNLTVGDKVQRMHYAYNLQGWLKAINNPLADQDPNGDIGIATAYGKDVFAEYLHYFRGDYKRTGTNLNASAKIAVNDATANTFKTKVKDLYNGNIAATVTRTGFSQTGAGTGIPDVMAQAFQYDVLNRLLESKTEFSDISSSGTFDWLNMTDKGAYTEKLSYDPNGNINTLLRKGSSNSTVLDNLTYKYNMSPDPNNTSILRKTDNKLLHVDEAATNVAPGEDIVVSQHIYNGANANYAYDAKGRLVKDLSKDIYKIDWTANDKVAAVIRKAGSSKPDLYFKYDATGHRLMKQVFFKNSSGVVSSGYKSIYVYDASGNLMATYKEELAIATGNVTTATHKLDENYIYGASRLGSVKRDITLFTQQKTPQLSSNKKWMIGGLTQKLLDFTSGTATLTDITSSYANAENNVAMAPDNGDSRLLRFFVNNPNTYSATDQCNVTINNISGGTPATFAVPYQSKGWLAYYTQPSVSAAYKFVRTEPSINYTYSSTGGDLPQSTSVNDYSVTYKGSVYIPTTGYQYFAIVNSNPDLFTNQDLRIASTSNGTPASVGNGWTIPNMTDDFVTGGQSSATSLGNGLYVRYYRYYFYTTGYIPFEVWNKYSNPAGVSTLRFLMKTGGIYTPISPANVNSNMVNPNCNNLVDRGVNVYQTTGFNTNPETVTFGAMKAQMRVIDYQAGVNTMFDNLAESNTNGLSKFSTYFAINASDLISFTLDADDAVKVQIDGRTVDPLTSWSNTSQAITTRTANVFLKKGYHKIDVYHYNVSSANGVFLRLKNSFAYRLGTAYNVSTATANYSCFSGKTPELSVLESVQGTLATSIPGANAILAEVNGKSLFVTLPNTGGKEFLLLTTYRGSVYSHRIKQNASDYTLVYLNKPLLDAQGAAITYDQAIQEVSFDALNDVYATGRNKVFLAVNKGATISLYEAIFDASGLQPARLLDQVVDIGNESGLIDYATAPGLNKLKLSLGPVKVSSDQASVRFIVHRGRGSDNFSTANGTNAVHAVYETYSIGLDDQATLGTRVSTEITSFARTTNTVDRIAYSDENHVFAFAENAGVTKIAQRACCYTGPTGWATPADPTVDGTLATSGQVKYGPNGQLYMTSQGTRAINGKLYQGSTVLSTLTGASNLSFFVPVMGLPLTPAVVTYTTTYATPAAPVLSRDNMNYEISDHLGNVRAVVTGNMIAAGGNVLNDRMNTSLNNWLLEDNGNGSTAQVVNHKLEFLDQSGASDRLYKNAVPMVSGAIYRLSFIYQNTSNVQNISNKLFLELNKTADNSSVGTLSLSPTATEARGEYIFFAPAGGSAINIAFLSEGGSLYLDDIRLDRIDNKQVQIVSLKDYYPFGAVMKGRSYTASSGKYRYGFNGKEYDEESEYSDFGARLYDAGIGRFNKRDIMEGQLPYLSPYVFAANMPIVFKEDGNIFVFPGDINRKMETKFYEALDLLQGTEAGSFLNSIRDNQELIISIVMPKEDYDPMHKGYKLTIEWDPEMAVEYKPTNGSGTGFVASPAVCLAHESRHLWQYLTGFEMYTDWRTDEGKKELGENSQHMVVWRNARELEAATSWEVESFNHIHRKGLSSVEYLRYGHNGWIKEAYVVSTVSSTTPAKKRDYDGKNFITGQKLGLSRIKSRIQMFYGDKAKYRDFVGSTVDSKRLKVIGNEIRTQFNKFANFMKQKISGLTKRFNEKVTRDAAGNRVGLGTR